jgi:hypothetical protein
MLGSGISAAHMLTCCYKYVYYHTYSKSGSTYIQPKCTGNISENSEKVVDSCMLTRNNAWGYPLPLYNLQEGRG